MPNIVKLHSQRQIEVASQSSLRIENVQSTASQIEGYMKQYLSDKVSTIGIFSD